MGDTKIFATLERPVIEFDESTPKYFHGEITGMRTWDMALTADEIHALYASTTIEVASNG